MELSNTRSKQAEDEDRLSALTDDILLPILARVDVFAAVRAGILSTRWRHLPRLLTELDIIVEDFLPSRYFDPNTKQIEKAMAALTKATSGFLGTSKSERTIVRLCITFYLDSAYSCKLSQLICDAIDSGKVKNIELGIMTKKDSSECSDHDMMQYAQRMSFFFSASPNLFGCLAELSLQNMRFGVSDIHRLLVSCEQLEHLILINCDTGQHSVLKVHIPDSKLRELELYDCSFERVELLCVPKLERLFYDYWISFNAPLVLDFVPCLEELSLNSHMFDSQKRFKLSEMLGATASIRALAMDFQGERIWIEPEGKQLCGAFRNLSELFIQNIFVEFKLLWTTVILEAAPSLHIVCIEVWDHPCNKYGGSYSEKTNGLWEASKFNGANHWQLKRLKLMGFRAVKEHLEFLRTIMKRAIYLETILLKDKDQCDDCDALDNQTSSSKSKFAKNKESRSMKRGFPKNEDEESKVVRQLRYKISSPAQIIFE